MAPPLLEGMFALKFVNAKNRVRTTPSSVSEIYQCVYVSPSASHDERFLGLLKGAILLIEVALPLGSVDSSESGRWNPHSAALWRNLVKSSSGPESLMKCVLLLEDVISPDWLHRQASHLFSAIPKQWRAICDASLPSIALRVSLLDNGLKYKLVDRSRNRS